MNMVIFRRTSSPPPGAHVELDQLGISVTSALSTRCMNSIYVEVSINGATPKWIVYNGKSNENPSKVDDLGVPLF